MNQEPLCLPLVRTSESSSWLDVLTSRADVLREYQRKVLADVARSMRTHRRILVQAPTGAGKTHLIAGLVDAAVEAELRVLVLATRTRLVRQLHDRLTMFGVGHGVMAASLPELSSWTRSVQVASVDT